MKLKITSEKIAPIMYPCPFCGYPPTLDQVIDGDTIIITCDKCNLTVSGENALEVWGGRITHIPR